MTIGAARGRVQVELISVHRDALAFASALTLYGLFYVAVFLNSLLSGNYIAPSDSLDFGLAAFLSRPMLWTDGMYSGYPIAADPQALPWYPLLILIRATGLGWNLFIIAAYIIASAGCFLLVRRMTGSNSAGVFGGVGHGDNRVVLGALGTF